jgi:acetyl esterase/lipase
MTRRRKYQVGVLAAALFALLLIIPGGASADMASLKASCATKDAADNDTTNGIQLPYRFCDDGIPAAGGRTVNVGAMKAVAVPEKYAGYAGLPAKALPADLNSGADANGNIALDADVSLPDPAKFPPGTAGYPLVVLMHGCCSGSKASWEAPTVDTAGERWHYSNAWFASRGFAVLTYTSRGFVDGNGAGSTGETQLDDRRYEINDYQQLAGLLADDSFFHVNPQRIVATGGSYGGGFSWLAMTDPSWRSPGGKNMKLATAAPKYGWTDLVQSLVPNGNESQDGSNLPATDGSSASSPLGFPKQSIVAALYASGKTGVPPGGPHATFPTWVDDAMTCLQSTDPYELNPLCASTLQTTLPSFIADRSAYYQNSFFSDIAAHPGHAVPVFSAGTFTDPLFPPAEHRRMVERLKATVPRYPVQEYYGDYQHFVQNKDKEWGDMCGSDHHVCSLADYPNGDLNAAPNGLVRTGATTRLNRFVDYYAVPQGDASQPKPSFNVTAALQICPDNATAQYPADEPGATFTADKFSNLAPNTLSYNLVGTQAVNSPLSSNPHALSSDPVANQAGNAKHCPVETTPAGDGVATYTTAPLGSDATMIGPTKLTVAYTSIAQRPFELNSRLYDVFPDGKAVMVDRGVRVIPSPNGTFTYQLHGNGWRFPAGHQIRIEIAQDDAPYIKASSVPSSAVLDGVKLEIPVR